MDEYEEAKKNYTESIDLPIGNIKFEYRKQNKKSWLIGSDYKIELLEASSGFQSFIPLFLVFSYIWLSENSAAKELYNYQGNTNNDELYKTAIAMHNNNNNNNNNKQILKNKLYNNPVNFTPKVVLVCVNLYLQNVISHSYIVYHLLVFF